VLAVSTIIKGLFYDNIILLVLEKYFKIILLNKLTVYLVE